MLVSTSRYTDKKTRELAEAFALCTGSSYSARGKKTVEKLVSEARKLGENTIALLSENEISFILVSHSGWEWKTPVLGISGYKIHAPEAGEPGDFEGRDASLLEALFGFDPYYSGEISISTEKGKLKFLAEGKPLLEIDYEVHSNEKQGEDNP